MLEYQKKKLLEKHINNIVKLEPFLLSISGYNPEETRLKIGNYHLHCTPGTFSLNNCKLLIFLGKKEFDYFNEYEKSIISLNLCFDATYFGNTISFYIQGKLNNLTNIRENVYSVDLEFTSISEYYKEIFLYLCELTTIYRKIYDTKLTPEQLKLITKVPMKVIDIQVANMRIRANLDSISPRHLKISLADSNMSLTEQQKYNYSVFYANREIHLTGTIVKADSGNYISALDYNIEFVHIISKYMHIQQKEQIDQAEELEEL